jgi:hypothetical protein
LSGRFQELSQLQRQVVQLFNESELRDLALALQVNYDALPGSGTSDKARELILLHLRLGRLPDLIARCQQERPDRFIPPTFAGQAGEEEATADTATALYQLMHTRFADDRFAAQTMGRLLDRPDSGGRQASLATLLMELMEDDPAFLRAMQATLQGSRPAGDVINQQVSLSGKARAEDIIQVGKVEESVSQLLKKLKQQK